jgi:hypothetical protein
VDYSRTEAADTAALDDLLRAAGSSAAELPRTRSPKGNPMPRAMVFTVLIVFLIAYGLWHLAAHAWSHAARRVDDAIASIDDPDDGFDHWVERHLAVTPGCDTPGCVTCALEREGAR